MLFVGAALVGGVRRRCGGRRWTRSCRAWSSATSSRRRRDQVGAVATSAALGGPAVAGVLIVVRRLRGHLRGRRRDASSSSLGTLAAIRTPPPPADAAPPSLRSVVEGVRYAGSRPELIGTYVVDMCAMFFGMPLAVFPALAAGLGRRRGASACSTRRPPPARWSPRSPAAGRRACTATAARSSLAAVGWGVAIACFGLSGALVARARVPGARRRRPTRSRGLFRGGDLERDDPRRACAAGSPGIEMLSWASGPTLGTAEAGAVGVAGRPARVGRRRAACSAWPAAGRSRRRCRRFWGYDARTFMAPPPSPARVTPAPL